MGLRGDTFVQRLGQMAFHGVEVPCQVVDAQAPSEVGLVAAGEQLGHVSEIGQTVIDRRRREQEHQLRAHLVAQKVEQAPVAGTLIIAVLGLAAAAAITEMVRLVDDHRVGQLGDPPEPLGELPATVQIGVAEHGETREVSATAHTADKGKPVPQVRLPDPLPRRLRSEQHHPLVLVQHQPLDEHQPHERLAEPNPVAQERPTVAPGDLHQRPVRLPLVAVEMTEHPRPRLVPLARREFPTPEVLVQRLGVHVERGVLGRVAGDGPQHVVAHIGRRSPVHIEPVLKLRHLPAALNLDVQLDVAGEPRPGEVAGPD